MVDFVKELDIALPDNTDENFLFYYLMYYSRKRRISRTSNAGPFSETIPGIMSAPSVKSSTVSSMPYTSSRRRGSIR